MSEFLTGKEKAARNKRLRKIDASIKRVKEAKKRGKEGTAATVRKLYSMRKDIEKGAGPGEKGSAYDAPPGKTLRELKKMKFQIQTDPRHGTHFTVPYRDPEHIEKKRSKLSIWERMKAGFSSKEHYHPWEHRETDPGN